MKKIEGMTPREKRERRRANEQYRSSEIPMRRLYEVGDGKWLRDYMNAINRQRAENGRLEV